MKQTRISREDWGALRMILCASGYAVYSQSTENKINESSCVTVHRRNAVITVDKDLLEKAQCEMFGKNSISNGSLLFHQESAAKMAHLFWFRLRLTVAGNLHSRPW